MSSRQQSQQHEQIDDDAPSTQNQVDQLIRRHMQHSTSEAAQRQSNSAKTDQDKTRQHHDAAKTSSAAMSAQGPFHYHSTRVAQARSENSTPASSANVTATSADQASQAVTQQQQSASTTEPLGVSQSRIAQSQDKSNRKRRQSRLNTDAQPSGPATKRRSPTKEKAPANSTAQSASASSRDEPMTDTPSRQNQSADRGAGHRQQPEEAQVHTGDQTAATAESLRHQSAQSHRSATRHSSRLHQHDQQMIDQSNAQSEAQIQDQQEAAPASEPRNQAVQQQAQQQQDQHVIQDNAIQAGPQLPVDQADQLQPQSGAEAAQPDATVESATQQSAALNDASQSGAAQRVGQSAAAQSGAEPPQVVRVPCALIPSESAFMHEVSASRSMTWDQLLTHPSLAGEPETLIACAMSEFEQSVQRALMRLRIKFDSSIFPQLYEGLVAHLRHTNVASRVKSVWDAEQRQMAVALQQYMAQQSEWRRRAQEMIRQAQPSLTPTQNNNQQQDRGSGLDQQFEQEAASLGQDESLHQEQAQEQQGAELPLQDQQAAAGAQNEQQQFDHQSGPEPNQE